MAVYKTKWFDRWAQKEGLAASSLCAAVYEMGNGLVDADLGGGLVKKRVARPGQGKSGGWRTLVAPNRADRWIFVYGFAKNERSNIGKVEHEALKKLSMHLDAPAVADDGSDWHGSGCGRIDESELR